MGEQRSIVRVQKNKDYTVINNTSIRDERLSWKAKAIHVFMLSKPDDWTFYNEEIMQWAKDGKDSFLAGLKELQKYGYVKKERLRVEGGKFDYVTIVYEVPYMNLPYTEKPLTEKPSTDKPLTENPQLLNTNTPSTESLNTDNNQLLTNNKQESVSGSLYDSDFGKLTTFYEKNIGPLLPVISQELGSLYDSFEDVELIREAFKISIQINAKNKMRYAEGILKNWKADFITTYEQLKAKEVREQNGGNKQQPVSTKDDAEERLRRENERRQKLLQSQGNRMSNSS